MIPAATFLKSLGAPGYLAPLASVTGVECLSRAMFVFYFRNCSGVPCKSCSGFQNSLCGGLAQDGIPATTRTSADVRRRIATGATIDKGLRIVISFFEKRRAVAFRAPVARIYMTGAETGPISLPAREELFFIKRVSWTGDRPLARACAGHGHLLKRHLNNYLFSMMLYHFRASSCFAGQKLQIELSTSFSLSRMGQMNSAPSCRTLKPPGNGMPTGWPGWSRTNM
ncbi:MAG: hypothetical protein A4E28_02938 [Methanocella sp. PtaU1.Bin125]|nr:MAG: hypothetical protein A4E28_02938 [Methanocella sp. PtaU1.Bin125]